MGRFTHETVSGVLSTTAYQIERTATSRLVPQQPQTIPLLSALNHLYGSKMIWDILNKLSTPPFELADIYVVKVKFQCQWLTF